MCKLLLCCNEQLSSLLGVGNHLFVHPKPVTRSFKGKLQGILHSACATASCPKGCVIGVTLNIQVGDIQQEVINIDGEDHWSQDRSLRYALGYRHRGSDNDPQTEQL